MITVQTLRQSGYKVRVLHLRPHIKDKSRKKIKEFFHKKDFKDKSEIYPKGGKTVVEITVPDNHNIHKGETFIEEVICSIHDGYKKSVGLGIALGRLQKKYGLVFS